MRQNIWILDLFFILKNCHNKTSQDFVGVGPILTELLKNETKLPINLKISRFKLPDFKYILFRKSN